MGTYEELMKAVARNIKFLNKQLSDYYEFEERAYIVSAIISTADLQRIRQLQDDVAMFEALANGMDIEFESELEQASATLTIE